MAVCCCVLQVHEAMVEAGAYPSPLNYYNFPKSVCTSVNEVRRKGAAAVFSATVVLHWFVHMVGHCH